MSLRKSADRSAPSPAHAREVLAQAFAARGRLRLPDARRRSRERQTYKKGFEVRLEASSRQEVSRIRGALRAIGLKPGREYRHHRHYVVPIYGRQAVEWFQSLNSHPRA